MRCCTPNNTRAVALSNNGMLFAALDNFDQTFVWDTTTGELLRTNNGLAYPFGAMQVVVSSDGKTFLNSGIDSKINYQIRVWNVENGRFLLPIFRKYFDNMSMSCPTY